MQRVFARRGVRLLALATLFAGLMLPAPVSAEEEPPARPVSIFNGVFDLLIVRPCGLVVTGIGVGLFVPAAFISAPGGLAPIQEALEHFVLMPGEYVFTRPLGEL